MTEQDACTLYEQGMSIAAISCAMRKSNQHVRAVLSKNGVRIRKSGWRMQRQIKMIRHQKHLDNWENSMYEFS